MAAVIAPDSRFGLGYAIAAYVVIFVGFFGYVLWLHASQRRLRRRLETLERQWPAKGRVGAPPASNGRNNSP